MPFSDLLSRHHRQVHQASQDGQVAAHSTPYGASTSSNPLDKTPGILSATEPSWRPAIAEAHANNVATSIPTCPPLLMDYGQGAAVDAGNGTEPLNLPAPPSSNSLDRSVGNQQLFPWDNPIIIDQLPSLDFFDLDFAIADMTQLQAGLPLGGQLSASDGRYDPQWTDTATAPIHSTMVSRLPSLEPTIPGPASDAAVAQDQSSAASHRLATMQPVNQSPWKVSAADYERLCQQVMARTGLIPDSFAFPSRQALSRYLEGYFHGLNMHMPFLHTPTLDHGESGLELVLCLAANGAVYRFEKEKSAELYRVAKTLIMARLDELAPTKSVSQATPIQTNDAAEFRRGAEDNEMAGSPSFKMPHDPVIFRLLQGLIVLMATSMWGKRDSIREALSMASLVATLVREVGINVPEQELSQGTSWENWIIMEERRRTLFVAYVLFSLQSATFDVPPMLLNREICLYLPAPAVAWKASSATAWADHHKAALCPPRPFQDTLDQLLSGADIHLETPLSAFGNYVLIHGLSIQVFLARNAADPFLRSDSSLSLDFIEKMEAALRVWQRSWEATHESSLDPSSPKGSLGFNCTAILRLVYIRLNVNTGFSRQLLSRDPVEIAHAFGDSNIAAEIKRSPHLDMAVLQCIYALSVPVRVGIAFVARTLTLNWSCQHAVSNLECAFLLAHWLRSVAGDIETLGVHTLRVNEKKMLRMVISLIRETDLADPLDEHSDHASQAWQASAATARLWAETFRGFHVFDVVQRIGESLSLAAENLEQI